MFTNRLIPMKDGLYLKEAVLLYPIYKKFHGTAAGSNFCVLSDFYYCDCINNTVVGVKFSAKYLF